MSRPTTAPRLQHLRPAEVAEEVCGLVADHLGRQVFRLGPAFVAPGIPTAKRLAEESDLGTTAQDLTRYAQTGALGDWGDASGALDAMQDVCEALYSQAGEPGTFGEGELAEARGDTRSPIGVVLAAAHARVQLAQRGGAVRVSDLAALAGVTPDAVRRMARDGEIEIADGEVRRAEALRWLGARGVSGLRKSTEA